MQRIRIKFTKQGLLKFISHRDLMRLIERALRRAELPMALSSGFNPHPKISFASALSVGVSSLSEYADITLSWRVPPREVLNRLNKKLPFQVRVLEAKEVSLSSPSLTNTINVAEYRVRVSVNANRKLVFDVTCLLDKNRVKPENVIEAIGKYNGLELKIEEIERTALYAREGGNLAHQRDSYRGC